MTFMKALYVIYVTGFVLSIYQLLCVIFMRHEDDKGHVREAFALCGIFFYLPIINLICGIWLMYERRQPIRGKYW